MESRISAACLLVMPFLSAIARRLEIFESALAIVRLYVVLVVKKSLTVGRIKAIRPEAQAEITIFIGILRGPPKNPTRLTCSLIFSPPVRALFTIETNFVTEIASQNL